MQKIETTLALLLLTIIAAMALLTTESEAVWLTLTLKVVLIGAIGFNYEFWWFVVRSFVELIADVLTSLLEKIKLGVRRVIMIAWAALGVWLIGKSVTLIGSTTQLWWIAAIEGFVLLGLLLMVMVRLRKI